MDVALEAWRALSMNASTAWAHCNKRAMGTPIRCWAPLLQDAMGPGLAAGVLAAQSVNVLQRVRLSPSRLCLPVSRRDSRVPVARGAHCSANCNGPKQRVQCDEPS